MRRLILLAAATMLVCGTAQADNFANKSGYSGSKTARLPYYSKLTRPASGAPKGEVIILGTSNTTNCGVQSDGTTYNVCVSNGSDWVDV